MKRIFRIIIVILAVSLFGGSNAFATVVNFDDLGNDIAVPNGYAGLTWGTSTIDSAYGIPGVWFVPRNYGFDYAIPHSSPNFVVNSWGPDKLWFGFSSSVFFNGAWFATPNQEEIPNFATQVRFYDDVGHTSAWLDITETPQFLSANFAGASTIWVERQGGTLFVNKALWYTMDDITYNASTVPEPATLLLLGSGLVGLLGFRRKFKK